MLFCGSNGKVYRSVYAQAGGGKMMDKGTQCGTRSSSYNRKRKRAFSEVEDGCKRWTYDDLMNDVLVSKETFWRWIFEKELIAKERNCPVCNEQMELVECNDRSDGFRWECRKRSKSEKHKRVISIRKGSWFEQSNMTLEEIVKFTYWWSEGLDQEKIKKQLKINPTTSVDWDMFYRETCQVTLESQSEKIGGEGKVVQIDESKFGKRKYHRGHKVEGQWVFGGIEDGSRKCFMVAVEKRDEATLLPINR